MMIDITVVDREGAEHNVSAPQGFSVMEAIRDSGLDELLALCGGCLSCATCHVYVYDAALDQLPPISQDEDDLLYSSEHRTDRSRLACQLAVDPKLVGMRFIIAPED